MSTAAYIVAVFSSLWIDYGWQPLPNGGHEYILQVPPELIDTLRTEGIESYVPAEVRDIRRIRITVGSERLPQDLTSSPLPTNEAATKSETKNSGPSQDAEPRTAKYAADTIENGRAPTEPATDDGIRGWLSSIGLDPLVVAQIGMGTAAAAVIFLAWAHLSLRRRYRALLHHSHGQ